MPPYAMLIILVVMMGGMMWFQSRSLKKRQAEARSFHESLEPGTEIITIGGIIGKVVSVDQQYEEIVIDSEGTLLRVSFRSVNSAYVRPAFISDEEAEQEAKATETSEASQNEAQSNELETNNEQSEQNAQTQEDHE